MRLKDSWAALAMAAALALLLSACQQHADRGGGDEPIFTDEHGLLSVPAASPLRAHLTVQPVGTIAGGGVLDLPAAVEVDPARVANVLVPLPGRVRSLKVALGQRVKQGQVLAVIASGDFAQARDDDQKAKDSLDLARKALARARGVQEAGGASGKDLEAAESAYAQAEAEAAGTRARLTALNGAAGGRSPDLILTAPLSGVVTSLAIAPGAVVDDPTAVLMTVTNLDRVFVTANVAEDDIGKVKLGEQAEITLTADPSRPIHASITELNAVVEPDTRRRKVRIALADGDGRLMPNMYATVRLPAPATGGVFVPQSALLMNNDAISVLVEVRPWVFRRQVVKIGDETDISAHVLTGLKDTDRVVVRGGVLLDD